MKLESESLEWKIKMEAEALKQKADAEAEALRQIAEAEAEALVQKSRAEQALKQEAFEQEMILKQQSARADQAIKDDAFAAERDRQHELPDLTTRVAEIRQPLDHGNTRNVQTDNVFKIKNVIKMLPKWIESDVESFVQAFESLAVANDGPEDKYLAIIQNAILPKALKVFVELPNDATYEDAKAALLLACKVVPEVHRKKFRT